MNPTQEEYNIIARKKRKYFEYWNDISNIEQKIKLAVNTHFYQFLNDAEQNRLKEIIKQNFTEKYGSIDEVNLPSGKHIEWELQIVVANHHHQLDEAHMQKWYSQKYRNQFANIIKSKKL